MYTIVCRRHVKMGKSLSSVLHYPTSVSGWFTWCYAVSYIAEPIVMENVCHADCFVVTAGVGESTWSLQWHHNERDGVSNHQPYDCLLNRLFRRRKHQSSASLAFVRGIIRSSVNFPHKGPVTRELFPFDDVIMIAFCAATEYEVVNVVFELLPNTNIMLW